MNSPSRLAIAATIARTLLREQGDNLLYVAAFGSGFRGDDTAHSDIDLLSVLNGPVRSSAATARSWISVRLDDVVLGLAIYTLDDVAATVGTPNYRWPYAVGKFLDNRPIYSEFDVRSHCRAILDSTTAEAFSRAATIEYLEALARLDSVRDHIRGDIELGALRSQALRFLGRTEAFLALVNRGFLHCEMSFLNRTIVGAFAQAPPTYLPLSLRLWHSNDYADLHDAMEDLFQNCTIIALNNGLQIAQHSSAHDIDFLTL